MPMKSASAAMAATGSHDRRLSGERAHDGGDAGRHHPENVEPDGHGDRERSWTGRYYAGAADQS